MNKIDDIGDPLLRKSALGVSLRLESAYGLLLIKTESDHVGVNQSHKLIIALQIYFS